MSKNSNSPRYDEATDRLLRALTWAAVIIGAAAVVIAVVQCLLAVPDAARSSVPLFTPPRMVPTAGFAFLAAFFIGSCRRGTPPFSAQENRPFGQVVLAWAGVILYVVLLTVLTVAVRVWWTTF